MKLVGRIPKTSLAPGVPVRLAYPPFDVVVARTKDGIFAIEDACNHAGASLAEGRVDEKGRIRCPMHGYLFELATGKLVIPRGLCADQRAFVVEEDGDDVLVYDAGVPVILP